MGGTIEGGTRKAPPGRAELPGVLRPPCVVRDERSSPLVSGERSQAGVPGVEPVADARPGRACWRIERNSARSSAAAAAASGLLQDTPLPPAGLCSAPLAEDVPGDGRLASPFRFPRSVEGTESGGGGVAPPPRRRSLHATDHPQKS